MEIKLSNSKPEVIVSWRGVQLSDCGGFIASPERLEELRKITGSKYCLPNPNNESEET